ncbi:MAG TPA: hypothetical protein VEK79_04335 [Thermoanaerobaculia bacterium]|nr:hypothetical protein [Thermoanaerobaculia bacterium]
MRNTVAAALASAARAPARRVARPGETLAATATGRYLMTLLPNATRFRYAIDVHNPNRATGVTPQYRGALAFETGTERISGT